MIIKDIHVFNNISGMYDDFNASIDKQKKQLDEELYAPNELMDSMSKLDVIGILDGTGDVGFVELSLALLMTHDPAMVNVQAVLDKLHQITSLPHSIVYSCIAEVSRSNLTKFDLTLPQLELTNQKYVNMGLEVDVKHKEGYYVTYSSKDQYDHKNKFYHKGKILKSAVNYTEPDFKEIAESLEVIHAV